MKTLVMFCVVALVGWMMAGAVAQAGHINEPTKWSQLPSMGEGGIDIRSEYNPAGGGQVISDDWQCTDGNDVVAVRWWGSYLFGSDKEPDAASLPRDLPFVLGIHYGYSEPCPDSKPGETMVTYYVDAQEHLYGTDYYDQNVYEYNAYLPTPFEQINGNFYWLDVQLDLTDPGLAGWDIYTWGWHTTDDPWQDKAVYSPFANDVGPWEKVCSDMAFEIMVPEPATVCLLGLGGLALLRKRR